jgi:hypothetical protein
MQPLIAIISALVGGASLSSIVAGMSITQWIALAEALYAAEPSILKVLGDLDPVLESLVTNIKNGVPSVTAASIAATLAANGQKAINLQPGAGSES